MSELRWPWDAFPEDGSTWDECVERFVALTDELETEKRMRRELKEIALVGFEDLGGFSDVIIAEKLRLADEVTALTEQVEEVKQRRTAENVLLLAMADRSDLLGQKGINPDAYDGREAIRLKLESLVADNARLVAENEARNG